MTVLKNRRPRRERASTRSWTWTGTGPARRGTRGGLWRRNRNRQRKHRRNTKKKDARDASRDAPKRARSRRSRRGGVRCRARGDGGGDGGVPRGRGRAARTLVRRGCGGGGGRRAASSVKRAISFDEGKETALVGEGSQRRRCEKTPAADALALSGASARRFRGKRRVSASAPRRTPAAGVSAPEPRRGTRGARRCLCSGWGTGDFVAL